VDLLQKLMPNVEVSTVDSYQGQEGDVVIISTVRTKKTGFVDDAQRLNVALTRAKRILRVVGDLDFFLSLGEKSTLRALALYSKDNGFVVSPFDIEDEQHGECDDVKKISVKDKDAVRLAGVLEAQKVEGDRAKQDMTGVVDNHREPSVHLEAIAEALIIVQGNEATTTEVSNAESGDEDTHSSKCDRTKQDVGQFHGELEIAMPPSVDNHREEPVHLELMKEALSVEGNEATATTTQVSNSKSGEDDDAQSSKLAWPKWLPWRTRR
jgi:hypothetical protein